MNATDDMRRFVASVVPVLISYPPIRHIPVPRALAAAAAAATVGAAAAAAGAIVQYRIRTCTDGTGPRVRYM